MIQKTMESNLPFRPPKSPSSIVNTHVVTPKSPTRRLKSRKHPKEPHYDEDLSDAASPTSVVNNGFRSNQHSHGRSRNKSERRGGAGRAPSPTSPPSQEAASDASLIQSGIQCIQTENQAGAVFAFSLLVEERKRRHGVHHAQTGSALFELGMVHLHFGDYKQAERQFAKAAGIQIRSRKAHPLDVVKCLVNLGHARLMQQKTDGARSVFCDAVKIVRTKLGYDDWHVASIQSQIGYIYFQVGDFEFALHAFADALAVHRANVNRGAIAETLCSIGSIHLEQKSFDPAIECFLEALHLQRETVGDFHPDVIVTLDNLAFCHVKKRDYDKALKYYNETLQAQVAFYGEFTYQCAKTKRKEQIVFKKYCSSRQARDRAFTA